MRGKKIERSVHPKGEGGSVAVKEKVVTLDTYGGAVQVEWDQGAAVTPLGQLPYFVEFLKTADLFDPWVEDCPLEYTSPNAPLKRDLMGTLFLSILMGQHRYAHITTVRSDTLTPSLLGMSKIVSEDSVRRGLKNLDREKSEVWLSKHLKRCTDALLREPWILDIDTTVKPLYGQQEGAQVGYNPKKPGRPSHALHAYIMANTRLILDVDVRPGKETAGCYSQPGLWKLLDGLAKCSRPYLIRGDVAYGNEDMLRALEERSQDYLFKLRQTKGVQQLIGRMFSEAEVWQKAGQGFEGVESELTLSGWTRPRKVVVLRRRLRGDLVLEKKGKPRQLALFSMGSTKVQSYECVVLVTSLSEGVRAMAQHYRDRADSENNFDELKNQWGWGGYTTSDLKRCQITAQVIALTYNWWSLFSRLIIPKKHAEAITTRPMLLEAIGKKSQHQRQMKVTITSTHAQANQIAKVLNRVSCFLRTLRKTAEQLSWEELWRRLLSRIFVYFLKGRSLRPPPLLTANA